MKGQDSDMRSHKTGWAAYTGGTLALVVASYVLYVVVAALGASQAKAEFVTGQQQFNRHQYREAAESFRQVVQRQPTFLVARHYLAWSLYNSGDKAHARLQWERVLDAWSVSRVNALYPHGFPQMTCGGVTWRLQIGDRDIERGLPHWAGASGCWLDNAGFVHCPRRAARRVPPACLTEINRELEARYFLPVLPPFAPVSTGEPPPVFNGLPWTRQNLQNRSGVADG